MRGRGFSSRAAGLALASTLGRCAAQRLARHELPVSMWSRSSKNKISRGDVRHFEASAQSGDSDELLCQVGACIGRLQPSLLPRKELFEAHAVATIVHQHFPDEPLDVVDACAGAGLLAFFLVLMNSRRRVRCVDLVKPPSAARLHHSLSLQWPVLASRISWEQQDFRKDPGLELGPSELLTSCHACSFLTDELLLTASTAGRPLAVLPCCHEKKPALPDRPWMPRWRWDRWPWLQGGAVNRQGAEAMDAARVAFLESKGYEVTIDAIDEQISGNTVAVVARPRGPA